MDKVEDTTEVKTNGGQDFEEPRQLKFRSLDQPQISESDLALWEQSPPVAELSSGKDTTTENKSCEEVGKKISHCFSVSAVVVTLACIWIFFAIPQLCYFKVGICTDQIINEELQAPIMQQNCSGLVYTGSSCLNNFIGSCPHQLVNVPANGTMEVDIATLFFLLDNTPLSSSCKEEKEAIKEFVCTYSYQPCDIDNKAYLPSRNDCEHFRDMACSSEWSILSNGQYGSLLPVCEELPYNVTELGCSDNSTSYSSPLTSDNSTSVITNATDNNSDNSNNATRTCVAYEGEYCSQYVDPCQVGSFETSTESSLSLLFGLFNSIVNDQSCKDNKPLVEEFLCLAAFPRCDEDHEIHLPNRSNCEYIRDVLCPTDWIELETNLMAASLLPNCSDLPLVSTLEVTCADPVPTPSTSSITTTTTTATPSTTQLPVVLNISSTLHCNSNEGFYLYIAEEGTNSSSNNTCQPLCTEWTSYTSQTLVLFDEILVTISTIVAILGAIAVIVFSLIRRERMFVFPSVFIIYGTIHVLILGMILIVQFVDIKGLSCAPDNLVLTTRDNPTVFCHISGFVLVHSLLGLTYWWFAHVCAIFWKIMFPFHAKRHEENGRLIHAVVVILGIILPLITPCLAFVWDGYSVNRFPPLLCLPLEPDVTYYGIVLPISFIVSIGITQLVFVIHAIHEKSRLFQYRVSVTHKFGLSTAEKKLLVVFVYYLILGYVDIIAFTVGISSSSQTGEYIEDNFECEALKTDPDFVCPRRFEELSIATGISLPTYILLGFYPIVNLIFAINKSEVKVKMVKWFPSVFTESYRMSTLSTSVKSSPDTPFTLKRRLTYQFSTTDHIQRSNEMATIGRSGMYLKREQSESHEEKFPSVENV